ncbi:MAG TPA: PhzF family phenazine biosynthesis protein [Anaerolineaceae bacterium]|nr:PhzF family phenazine biosynthesis protein [Anaerolineaceae bacterium]
MKYPIYQVDAFTVSPFSGNPAAVVLLDRSKEDDWMQAVASEMNLSETAFLLAKGDDYSLRWFTPVTEVDLCGHATLASAHILYESGYYELDETIQFITRSGVIKAAFDQGTIELTMPRREPIPFAISADIKKSLNLNAVDVARWQENLLLIELESSEQVRDYEPDIKNILQLPWEDLVITARDETGKFDFVSRFFAPQLGINEDPVTGMSFCVLGPYWQEKLGKSTFHAFQASPRGGEVWVKVEPDHVLIGGKAVTVLKGDLQHQRD